MNVSIHMYQCGFMWEKCNDLRRKLKLKLSFLFHYFVTMEKCLQCLFVISVFYEINKWIYSAIKKHHENGELVISAVEI